MVKQCGFDLFDGMAFRGSGKFHVWCFVERVVTCFDRCRLFRHFAKRLKGSSHHMRHISVAGRAADHSSNSHRLTSLRAVELYGHSTVTYPQS